MVREGVRALLEREPDLEVVGEAETGAAGADLALAVGPDVVVLDSRLPDIDGATVTLRLRRERPDIAVVMLTMFDDANSVDRALRAGVRGYVVKDSGADVLADAIRAARRGEIYLAPGVSDYVVQGYLRKGDDGSPGDPLTPREREVLQLIAAGQSSREVAAALGIAPKTVQNMRTRIMEKLGVSTTAGLVRFAFRSGLTH